VAKIPVDPLGIGYGINPAGLPAGLDSIKK
jgi:hypothetical protein